MALAGGRWGSPWTPVLVASVALLIIPLAVWLLLPLPNVTAPVVATASTLEAAPTARPVEKVASRTVNGLVTDEAEAPLSGVRVRFDVGGKMILEVTTGADGRYSLEDLPLDAGTVVAEKEGFGLASRGLGAAADGGEEVVDLVLTEAAAVAGLVLDPNGRPVSQAFVGCEGHEDTFHGTHTDTEGRFKLPADNVGCRAIADHPNFGQADPVVLRGGDDNILRLAGPGGIAGIVVDERGTPVSSYLIAIESYTPPPGRDILPLTGNSQTVNDPGGAFELTPLSAGTYVLTASAEGRPPALSSRIEVEAGRTSSGVRITLPVGATLSGTVTDKDTGRPIAGASIKLDAATATGALGVPPVTTDADGKFRLAGVPPTGRFSVRIDREGYNSSVVPGLEAGGSAEMRRDFQLTPGEGETEMAGIGAVLFPVGTGVIVVSTVPDGPAALAELKKGDRITHIDGVSTEGKSLSEVIQTLRGAEGSRVGVSIDREGETFDVTMVRAVIVR